MRGLVRTLWVTAPVASLFFACGKSDDNMGGNLLAGAAGAGGDRTMAGSSGKAGSSTGSGGTSTGAGGTSGGSGGSGGSGNVTGDAGDDNPGAGGNGATGSGGTTAGAGGVGDAGEPPIGTGGSDPGAGGENGSAGAPPDEPMCPDARPTATDCRDAGMLCQYADARCVCTLELTWECARTDCPTDRPENGMDVRCANMDTTVCRYDDAICACRDNQWQCNRCPDAPPSTDVMRRCAVDGAVCPYVGGPSCTCTGGVWVCR